MAVQHSALTGADLHESKGAAAASINTVAIADGAGSTAWGKVTDSVMTGQKGYIVVEFNNISAGETIYVPFGMAVTINKVTSVIFNAITVANNTITCYNAAGASMGTITVAFSGSAAGDIDTLSPGASNTISANSYMRLVAGGSTTACRAYVMIEYTRT